MVMISVVVPIYNVGRYLRQCLDSIVNQTFKDMEIILLDDGSTDDCGKIIDEYAQKDSRIIPIHKENSGYGKTINKGFDIAKGKYIGIIESDDYIEPDMYEKLFAQIEESNADVCKAGFYTYNSKNKPEKQNEKWSFKGQDYEKFPKRQVFDISEYPEYFAIHASIWVGLYRKSYLDKYNIRMEETEGASYQDFPFITKVLCNTNKIVLIPEYMYHWRVEQNQNSSTTINNSKLLIMTEQSKKAIEIMKETGRYEVMKEALYKHIFNANFPFYQKISMNYKKEYFNRLYEIFSEIGNDKSFEYKYFYEPFEKRFVKNIIKKKYTKTIHTEYRLFKKLQKLKNKRIAFWGASLFLDSFLDWFNISDSNIVGIFDKNSSRHGQFLKNYEIVSWEKINSIKPDVIIISVMHHRNEIRQEILNIIKNKYKKKCSIMCV